MMRKRLAVLAMVVGLCTLSSMTAFAGKWQKDGTGWWWQEDNGSYPTSTWKWIDGNNDGIAESYYFDADGYMLTNTTTPDGYTVNADGAWTVNGIVQTKQVTSSNDSTISNQQEEADWVKQVREFEDLINDYYGKQLESQMADEEIQRQLEELNPYK